MAKEIFCLISKGKYCPVASIIRIKIQSVASIIKQWCALLHAKYTISEYLK